jgi:hypothetical protein
MTGWKQRGPTGREASRTAHFVDEQRSRPALRLVLWFDSEARSSGSPGVSLRLLAKVRPARGPLLTKVRAALTSLPPSERTWLLGALTIGVGVIALDMTVGGWRDFWQARALTAGLLAGGLIVPPLLIILERFIARRDKQAEGERARRQQERWRRPAIDAIKAYAFVAVNLELDELQLVRRAAVERLGEHRPTPIPNDDENLRRLLAVLLRPEHDFWRELYDFYSDAAARMSRAALSIIPTLGLYPPLSHIAQEISDSQRTIHEAATVALYADPRFARDPDRAEANATELVNLRSQRATLNRYFTEYLHSEGAI